MQICNKDQEVSCKNYKLKQIIHDMINFYLKPSGNFSIFKNDWLQHVKISSKIDLLDKYKSLSKV